MASLGNVIIQCVMLKCNNNNKSRERCKDWNNNKVYDVKIEIHKQNDFLYKIILAEICL